MAGYVQELTQVEEMLDQSYADLDSGRKRLSSDEAETYYRRKIAAEHDASFRAAIQAALDDPRPLVPHAEVTAQFAKLRSETLRKVRAASIPAPVATSKDALFCQVKLLRRPEFKKRMSARLAQLPKRHEQ